MTAKLPRRRSFFIRFSIALSLLTLGASEAAPTFAASLTPSRAGLLRQVGSAREHQYTYLANDSQVRDFVRKGYLVPITGNRDFVVKGDVYHKAGRPEVKLFLERLGQQYRNACGERLVVTSLVRPKSRQPRNSSSLSVHPTGMAMDLRVPRNYRCRSWLERALVGLEGSGILEAARERYPPHYHVVLFPRDYVAYLQTVRGVQVAGIQDPVTAEENRAAEYRVRRGDSLWKIARSHGTTVHRIQNENGLRSNQIKPGQVLAIPVR